MPIIAITRGEKLGEDELSSGNSKTGGGGIIL